MNKHIQSAVFAATLVAGAAFAQINPNSERHNPSQPGIAHPEVNTPIYGNSGWTLEQDLYNGGRPLVVAPDARHLRAGRLDRWVYAYPRTRRDRDGDGVRNQRDRYPDDPRYR